MHKETGPEDDDASKEKSGVKLEKTKKSLLEILKNDENIRNSLFGHMGGSQKARAPPSE